MEQPSPELEPVLDRRTETRSALNRQTAARSALNRRTAARSALNRRTAARSALNRRTAARSVLLSVGAHAMLLVLLLGVFHRAVRLAPYRLPGTAQGTRLLTYYAPGSPQHVSAPVPVKKPDTPPVPSALLHTAAAAKPKVAAQATPAERGSGDAAESGSGQGDIAIALQKFFPYPAVDVSVLPHHSSGDVILNATIDADGKVADLTLLHGLGDPIDSRVIATVKQWTYTPARRNGVPVASEQELHFHFERG